MEISRVLFAIGLLVGLGTVLATHSQNELRDHFVKEFQAYKAMANELGLRVAELLTAYIGAKHGLPIELEQIEQEVKENGLAWQSAYEHELKHGVWHKIEYAEALIETYEQMYGESINSLGAEMDLSVLRESCEQFIFDLGGWVFKELQSDAKRSNGDFERQVRRGMWQRCRNDVAELVLGWSQYLTCKSLVEINADGIEQLERNIKSLLEAGGHVAEMERKQREDPHKIVSISAHFPKALEKVPGVMRELVEYFYLRLTERHGTEHNLAKALESLKPDLLSPFLDKIGKFGQKSDAEAMLYALKHPNAQLIAGHKFEEQPGPNMLRMRPEYRLSMYTKNSLQVACREYIGVFERIFTSSKLVNADMAKWIAETSQVVRLDESGRNKLRDLLRGWASCRACMALTALTGLELEGAFRKLGFLQLLEINLTGLK